MKKLLILILLPIIFLTTNLQAFEYSITEDLLEISIIEQTENNELKNSAKRLYIVNEDGTITFLKSVKRLYIVNEDGTVTFLN